MAITCWKNRIYNIFRHLLKLRVPRLAISWLLMPWRCKEPGHQQSWYRMHRINRSRASCAVSDINPSLFINSLTPGRGGNNFEIIIFELICWIYILRNSSEIVLWRMPKYQIRDKSILVQVMAWCQQATSHYLSQCWFSSLSPYGVTRPQWANSHTRCRPFEKKNNWKIWLVIKISWNISIAKKIIKNFSRHTKLLTFIAKNDNQISECIIQF